MVHPVADLMEIPDRYLALLPSANLQSLSVAVGQAGVRLADGFLRFADACGNRGVTAIRTVGRGAFPQLAYSWDGLLPLDLVCVRPPGHFTTIEFDAPRTEIAATWQIFQRLAPAINLSSSIFNLQFSSSSTHRHHKLRLRPESHAIAVRQGLSHVRGQALAFDPGAVAAA
jgi:hypothetical protein